MRHPMESNGQKKPRIARETALVTGGSGGIGLELAKELARHGHSVVLVARKRDPLEAAAGHIEGKYGVKATVFAADLADPVAPTRIHEGMLDQGINIGILVNNAGFGIGGPFIDTDTDRELDMIQVNVTSVIHLTKLFLPAMVKRRRGHVMNVASTAAFQPGPLMSVYYASKAFVLSFSEAIAEELRNTGVSVTALCPGPTDTGFASEANVGRSRLLHYSPVADPEDVARYGYRSMMKGERVAIPALRDKLMIQAERLTPRRLVTVIARKLQEARQ
jgi:short-subunit dehydrogenase